jgi:hypothetical protein
MQETSKGNSRTQYVFLTATFTKKPSSDRAKYVLKFNMHIEKLSFEISIFLLFIACFKE